MKFIFFFLFFSPFVSFAQTNDSVIYKLPLYLDCAHGHICCESFCNCCPELFQPQQYDTIETVQIDNVKRHKIIERHRYAISHERSYLHYLFTDLQGNKVGKFYVPKYGFSFLGGSVQKDLKVNDFKDGPLLVFNEQSRYYLINGKGEKSNVPIQIKERLTEDVSLVSILVNQSQVFGLVNNDNELLNQGLAYARINDVNEEGYIIADQFMRGRQILNSKGEKLFSVKEDVYREFGEIIYLPSSLGGIGGGLFKHYINRKPVLVNVEGEILSDTIFDGLGNLSEGFIDVAKSGKSGFINIKGELVILTEFDYVRPFKNGRAAVYNGEFWGFIDSTGKLVIPYQFTGSYDFSDGLAPVSVGDNKEHNNWGVIDLDGNFIVNPMYYKVYPFVNGYAKASIYGEGEGIINRKGKVIVDLMYDIPGYGNTYPWFENGILFVRTYGKERKCLLIDEKGKIQQELKGTIYANRVQVTNRLEWPPYIFTYSKSSEIGMVDFKGEEIIEMNYDEIYVLNKELAILKKGDKYYLYNFILKNKKFLFEGVLATLPSQGLIRFRSESKEVHFFNFEGTEIMSY